MTNTLRHIEAKTLKIIHSIKKLHETITQIRLARLEVLKRQLDRSNDSTETGRQCAR